MKHAPVILLLAFFATKSRSQNLTFSLDQAATSVEKITYGGSHITVSETPLIGLEVNGIAQTSASATRLKFDVTHNALARGSAAGIAITMTNMSTRDTVVIRNVVPFGVSQKYAHITGMGDHPLSRAYLFLPGKMPVNVILPDNAWECGYRELRFNAELGVAAITRLDRNSIRKGSRKRFETTLFPGGSVRYNLYADVFFGPWQNGLRKMFAEHMLFDVSTFDESLYNRKDLQWIREAYVMHLVMAWDKVFVDLEERKRFLARAKHLYGGDDVVGLWPTWPTLGLDQRTQFDLFEDLPGGLAGLRAFADSLRAQGTRFFVCYNPWDEQAGTNTHLSGLSRLIAETSADGVVLDTRGESSAALQKSADDVRPGVIMYSEGMAVPKNMPGILSGRVHNALYYPPMLNLNKLIKPEFAIFRVAEVFKEPIKREYALSFFNGYGTEINQFAAGHPEWEDEQYRFLGRTTRILRENSANFHTRDFTPLVDTQADSIWVNAWSTENKTIYTVFSLRPEGFEAPLIEIEPAAGFHYVDLWHHEERTPVKVNEKFYLVAKADAFPKTDLGTNNEGSVDCLARFPEILKVSLEGDELSVGSTQPGTIRIWKGVPSWEESPYEIVPASRIALSQQFGRYEGKFTIQLVDNGMLRDERIVHIKAGTPRLVSIVEPTPGHADNTGMIRVPPGKFTFRATHGDEFIAYPTQNVGDTFDMKTFYIDKFPVTNAQFKKFLDATHYHPVDTINFLKHWTNGSMVKGEENFPVVYISWEDARAYAVWAGKRLPTEIEWQYAAQTSAHNEWPWKQKLPVTRVEEVVNETLTVTAIQGINPKHTNTGDGKRYAVGSFPAGANPLGIQDLSGCVWQLTNDLYQSGSYRYIIMKGGSYYKPSASWWYVQGGPRELHYRQFLLRVSQGFERNSTVGFRCVRDISK